MNIKIYNTLTRKKEVLRPLEDNHIKLYVCGITSYDYCHIGHARSALVFDMVVRYLRYRGFKVTFVRNFTDIDDKIIARAAEKGVDSRELAQQFIDEFYTDMDALGVLRADIEPRATEHIDEMIELVSELIDRGLAYLIQEHYLKHNRPRRACHPRDIVDQLIDIARYLNVKPALTKDLIDQACEAYFVEI